MIQNTVFSQCCGSSTVLTFLIFVIRTVDYPCFLFHWVDLLHDGYTACKSSNFFLVFIFWTSVCFSGLRPPHHWWCSVFWIIQNTVFSQCCGSSTVLTFLIFVIRTVDHPCFIFHWVDLLHDGYTACKSSDFFLVFIFWTSVCFSGLRPPHHWRCSVFWIIQNTVFSTDFLPFCQLHNLSIL